MNWSHLELELPSKPYYWRRDRMDRKRRKTAKEAIWMILRERKDNWMWQRRRYIRLSGKFPVDLSERIQNLL